MFQGGFALVVIFIISTEHMVQGRRTTEVPDDPAWIIDKGREIGTERMVQGPRKVPDDLAWMIDTSGESLGDRATTKNGPVLNQKDRRSELSREIPRQRIAVLTSGTARRYLLDSVERLVAPMVRQGHSVDYFLALNKEKDHPYWIHENFTAVPDPRLGGAVDATGVKDAEVQQIINKAITEAGGVLRHLSLFDSVPISPTDPHFEFHEADHRGQSDNATVLDTALSNFIKWSKALEGLWYELLRVENSQKPYTYVITIRDDAYWLRDFDFDRLLSFSNQLPSVAVLGRNTSNVDGEEERTKALKGATPRDFKGAPAFSLRCNDCGTGNCQRWYMGSICDFVWILPRKFAQPFGTPYSELLAYGAKTERQMVQAGFPEEMFFDIAEKYKVTFKNMDLDLMPFQPAAYMVSREASTETMALSVPRRHRSQILFTHKKPLLCLHHVCNSGTIRSTELIPDCDSDIAEIKRVVAKQMLDSPAYRGTSIHRSQKSTDSVHRVGSRVQKEQANQTNQTVKVAKSNNVIAKPRRLISPSQYSISLSKVFVSVVTLGVCVALLTVAMGLLTAPCASNILWTGSWIIPFVCGLRWLLCSAGLVIFNKWMFMASPAGLGFKCPVFLIWWQMAFATVLTKAIQLWSLFARADDKHTSLCVASSLTWLGWVRQVLPIGILISTSLSLGNEAMLRLNVPYLQVIKACDPLIVYVLSVLLAWDTLRLGKVLAVSLIGVGAVVFTGAEMSVLNFSVTGMLYQVGATFTDAARLLVLQKLVSQSDVKLNPMAALSLMAPVCVVCLAPFVEWPDISDISVWSWSACMFLLLNAMWAVGLNLSLLTFFQYVPASYVSLLGCIKDASLIFGSAFVFGNELTMIHVAGLATSITGTCWFMSYGKEQQSSDDHDEVKDAKNEQTRIKALADALRKNALRKSALKA